MEIFRELKLPDNPEYNGLYRIGNYGTLISKRRLSCRLDRWGNFYSITYPERTKAVRFSKKSPLLFTDLEFTRFNIDGTKEKFKKTVYIHKLVAMHFIKRSEDLSKNKVAHINHSEPTNNSYKNLIWADQAYFSIRNMILYPENRDKLKEANIESGYYKELSIRMKNKSNQI